jgi:hypothetical protein
MIKQDYALIGHLITVSKLYMVTVYCVFGCVPNFSVWNPISIPKHVDFRLLKNQHQLARTRRMVA